MLATVASLKVSMIGLRGVTRDIMNRIRNPVTDHQMVPGTNSGTEEPTGTNIMTGTKVITCEPNGTKNVLSDQTGTQVTRSHISNEVSGKIISDHHTPLTIRSIHNYCNETIPNELYNDK